MVAIFSVFGQMIYHVFRRGRGIFKLLFMVDDFIRLFAMTLLIPIGLRWIGLSGIIVTLGVILGAVIDIHDFISEAGIGKIQNK